MRVLGLPLESPPAIVNRTLADLGAVARAARTAPAQLQRILELGEEMAAIGRGVLEIAERLDRRADAALALGERLDARADELLKLGRKMETLGERVDKRGGEMVEAGNEIVASSARLAETGTDLIGALPTLQRAIEMASPLEGAIDRFGRLVDRLPGGTARRTGAQIEAYGTEIVANPEETGLPEGPDQLDG